MQVVNVLVTPEQAEVLSLATSQTSIRLTLRNPLDRDVAKTPGTALKFVWQGAGNLRNIGGSIEEPTVIPKPRPVRTEPKLVVQNVPPPAPKKEAFVMEILSGSARSEAKFGKTEDK